MARLILGGNHLQLSAGVCSSGPQRCDWTVASWKRDFAAPAARPLSSRKWMAEKLWREFFSDPSQWWDHRSEKGNAKYPDFKNKETKESLWISSKLNPKWVEAALAAMAPGTVQSNIFSWNKKLERYVKAGQYEKTMELFEQMQQEDMSPDTFTFVQLLNICAKFRALGKGKQIHRLIIQNGHESHVFVGNSLIDMYAKCGSIKDARRTFDIMSTHDVVSWNSMILGHVKCGQGQEALKLFQEMQQEGVEPNPTTFAGLLNACASVGALEQGRLVHQQIIESGCEFEVFVSNNLVEMYAKCGSIEDAWRVFNKLPTRNVFTWSAMILGYVKCGEKQKAFELCRSMQQEGVEPNPVIFVGLLRACATVGALEEGRHVHERVIESGFESEMFVGSSLVHMYCECGSLEDACKVFKKLVTRDVVCWTSMIRGYAKSGQGQRAIELYRYMQEEGVEPDHRTFVGLLNACASVAALEEGKRVHEQIVQRGCESDTFVASSLVNMYAKCGSIEAAREVFNNTSRRDVFAWSAMILGYVRCGQGQRALELSRQMQQEGVEPDRCTFVGMLNACASLGAIEEGRRIHQQIIQRGYQPDVFVDCSLVDMYAKCGSIDDAWQVFNEMPARDVVAWSTMILAYVKFRQGRKALELYQLMQEEGLEPDYVTFVGLLNACASLAAIDAGRFIHQQITQSGCQSNVYVSNSLVNMYAKCGSIEDASRVFHKMATRDLISWNTLLAGYSMHGQVKKALGLFQAMSQEGVGMDELTFVSLLSACSRAGLVDEGLHYFESMSPTYSISATMEHFACMVDLLGRAGCLNEAEDMIKTMSCAPDTTVWISLLGACRIYNDMEMGERVTRHVLKLDPGNGSIHVLLSNMYAAG